MSVLVHTPQDPLRPPPAPAMGRGFALALLAHALLVAGLSLGVQWHSQPEPAFEAELWSVVPQAAAPAAQEPEPTPPPKPNEATPAPPPPPDTAQQQRDAEIAIARDKALKKREDEARRQAELDEQRKKDALKQQQAEDEKKKAQEKDRLRKEELARKELQDKQEKQDKLDKLRQDKAAQAKLDALRKQTMDRLMGLAGATGVPGSTGTAQRSTGPSASYGGRIKARVRPNIIYTNTGNGNPVAEVEVRCAPDGTIVSRKLTQPSGDADWDRAVLRAIDKTETLPRDVDGRVPPVLVITFKPGE